MQQHKDEDNLQVDLFDSNKCPKCRGPLKKSSIEEFPKAKYCSTCDAHHYFTPKRQDA